MTSTHTFLFYPGSPWRMSSDRRCSVLESQCPGGEAMVCQDEGPLPGLVTKLQRYKDADKCRSYALLKENQQLKPAKKEELEVKRVMKVS